MHVYLAAACPECRSTTMVVTQGNRVLMLDLAGHQRLGNEWDVVRGDGEGA